MRLGIFLGVILGIFLTVGSAFTYDTISGRATTSTSAIAGDPRPMVNWDVVSNNWHHFTVGVRNTWHKLAAR